jgi:hypothetical protein
MHLYFGRSYTAAVSGARIKEVRCEKCGQTYFYRLVRRGEGRGTSPYYLNNRGAERRAQAGAERKLAKLLERGVDPVPCPDCGWIQANMVREIRRRKLRWMNVFSIAFAILFGVIIGIWIPTATKGFERPMKQDDWAVLGVMAGLLVVTAGGPWLLRQMLLRLRNPNRYYPQCPPPIPGAPRAFKDESSASAESAAQDEHAPVIEPSGWMTVQLLDVPHPAQCCSCLDTTGNVRVFKPATLVEIPLRVCPPCWKMYRMRQWFWTIGGALIAAAIAYGLLMLSDDFDEQERIIFACFGAFFGMIAALVIATKMTAPVRFGGFNNQLNTIRIKFANLEFIPVFVDAQIEQSIGNEAFPARNPQVQTRID